MKQNKPKSHHVLAIALTTRGFGFTLLEGEDKLIDWGVKEIGGGKNEISFSRVEKLITHYKPNVLVLLDVLYRDSRRSPIVKELSQQVIDLGKTRKIRVVQYSREQLKKCFFPDGEGTKYTIAEMLTKRFPSELGICLPPKRRPWMNEDRRMDIFDAVALALLFRLKTTKKVDKLASNC